MQFTGLFEFGMKQLAIYLRFQELGPINILVYENSDIVSEFKDCYRYSF